MREMFSTFPETPMPPTHARVPPPAPQAGWILLNETMLLRRVNDWDGSRVGTAGRRGGGKQKGCGIGGLGEWVMRDWVIGGRQYEPGGRGYVSEMNRVRKLVGLV